MTLRWAVDPFTFTVMSALMVLALAIGFLRSSKGGRWTWIRRTILVAMAMLIGMTPSIPSGTTKEATNIEVFFVLDRSVSMLADDQADAPSRLKAATEDIKKLTTDLAGSRFAALTFSSELASAVPLTTDGHAISSWADTVTAEQMLYASGSSVSVVPQRLAQTLQTAKERHPSHIRLVVLLTDGEDTMDSTKTISPEWSQVKELCDGGLVLGYGTTKGGKMPEYQDGFDQEDDKKPSKPTSYVMDPETGQVAISKANPERLKQIAQATGLNFAMRTGPYDFTQLVRKVQDEAKAEAVEDNRSEVTVYRDFVWPFVWVAVAMLAWELYYLGDRRRRLKEDRKR